MYSAGVVCDEAQVGMKVAVISIRENAEQILVQRTVPYPERIRVEIAALEQSAAARLDRLGRLHSELGQAAGQALRAALEEAGLEPAELATAGGQGLILQGDLVLGDLARAAVEAGLQLTTVDWGTMGAVDCARQAGYAYETRQQNDARTEVSKETASADADAVVAAPAAASASLTEAVNPRTADLDRLPTLEMLRRINVEDARVPRAVAQALPQIAAAVDQTAARMRQGGRLIYIGAGTSGRLGVLDASEIPPTYGMDPERVVGVIAGGERAIRHAVEGAEDNVQAGEQVVADLGVGPQDSVVGIAASGRTPFVLGALEEARRRGALTISVACNTPSAIESPAEIRIALLVGSEVISGSTRMKAGTAQKLVLNMLSTGVMVRLGKTFGNLMVDLRASNQKLRVRAGRIVAHATGLDEASAVAALEAANGEVKTAIVAVLAGVSPEEARRRLERNGGFVRQAVDEG